MKVVEIVSGTSVFYSPKNAPLGPTKDWSRVGSQEDPCLAC